MLVFNSSAKAKLAKCGLTKTGVVYVASLLAGFGACVLSAPFDYMKTITEAGAWQTIDFQHLYYAFPMYYLRITPHALITLIAQDQLKKFI